MDPRAAWEPGEVQTQRSFSVAALSIHTGVAANQSIAPTNMKSLAESRSIAPWNTTTGGPTVRINPIPESVLAKIFMGVHPFNRHPLYIEAAENIER